MSATSGSDEPIVDGMVMVTSADRETTVLLLPVMVVWHGGCERRAAEKFADNTEVFLVRCVLCLLRIFSLTVWGGFPLGDGKR